MKKYFLTAVIFLTYQFIGCGGNKEILPAALYKYYFGSIEGYEVWIVSGEIIRSELFEEFIFGGNDKRYTFIPANEIWIEDEITAEEFETTLKHEITEEKLMAGGMTYYDSHDSALASERFLRLQYMKRTGDYEDSLHYVFPFDYDSTVQIEDLQDSIKLKNVYRVPFGKYENYYVWIVDGFTVRRDIYPDFGYSGNYLAYAFIPSNEIWIDGSISCGELKYSIMLEANEIKKMKAGESYEKAYLNSLEILKTEKKKMEELISEKKPIIKTSHPYRD